MAKFKIKLKDSENVQLLLQEIYDEACKNLVDIQTQINKLQMSTSLNDESIDGKAKFAKAMNDFFATRDKAAQKKLEIARLMSDIIKNESKDSNSQFAMPENFDWDDIKDAPLKETKEEYKLK